jgi:hypothetical protein
MQGSRVIVCREHLNNVAEDIFSTYLTMFFRARSDTSWDFTGLNGNTQILSI